MMKTILYDITSNCNLRCRHCYNSSSINDSTLKEDYTLTINYIKNIPGIERVHILGGEPLMSKNIWKFIDSLPNNIKVSINTNGTLIDKYAKELLMRPKIDQLTVSLDGADAKTNDQIRGDGVFNRVCKNLLEFNKLQKEMNSQLTLNIAYVITPDNIDNMEKLPLTVNEIKVDCLMLSFLYYEGNAKYSYNERKYDLKLLHSKLIEVINNSKLLGIEVILDIKPIFSKLIQMTNEEKYDFKNIGNYNCYAIDDIIYISNNNQVYPCGPSSKLKDNRYMQYDLSNFKNYDNNIFKSNILNREKDSSCSACIYSDICGVCPLGIKNSSRELCEYALGEISMLTKKLLNKKIILTKDVRIVKKDGNHYLINFKTFRNYKLGDFDDKDIFLNQGIITHMVKYLLSEKDKNEFLINIYSAYKNKDIKLEEITKNDLFKGIHR